MGATFIISLRTGAVKQLAACCLPALRAARMDPLVALRYE